MLCFGLADYFRFLNAKLDVLGAGRDEQEWSYIKAFATKKTSVYSFMLSNVILPKAPLRKSVKISFSMRS